MHDCLETLSVHAQNETTHSTIMLERYLSSIAYTLHVGREPMKCRIAIVVSNIEELLSEIKSFLDGKDSSRIYQGVVTKKQAVSGISDLTSGAK